MNLRSIWKTRKLRKLFQTVPGPSPWYLRSTGPRFNGYKWVSAGESADTAGKVLLKNSKYVFMIVDFHNYISLLNRKYFVIWHQSYVSDTSTCPVNLKIIDPKELKPIDGNINELCKQMKNEKTPVLFNAPIVAEVELSTVNADEYIDCYVPPPISEIDELLILCHSSGIRIPENGDNSNVGLIVVNPKMNRFRIYPQDWFNNGGYDYGYQWITQVVRDKKSREIYGDGIRISPFVLDESLRNKKNLV